MAPARCPRSRQNYVEQFPNVANPSLLVVAPQPLEALSDRFSNTEVVKEPRVGMPTVVIKRPIVSLVVVVALGRRRGEWFVARIERPRRRWRFGPSWSHGVCGLGLERR